jgi:hypothetical protein
MAQLYKSDSVVTIYTFIKLMYLYTQVLYKSFLTCMTNMVELWCEF